MSDLKALLSDWPRLSHLLDEALDLDPAARPAWVDALAESESIRHELRDLLARLEAAMCGPLDAPRLHLGPEDGDDDSIALLAPGMRVGPYRLLRELGHGGMGVVWLAERDDGTLQRSVALKLPTLGGSRGLHERMRRERDILASLAHANIARIHDAGVDDHGRPYLALEYIEGEPIDRYVQGRALPTTARLRLLLQVAHAVAHAHGRLIVHRDLKPANILVTAEGEVRLLDFGIARLLEGERAVESPLTRQVGRVLTMDYASPEQLRGEPIGTASDVYS
ncbi:MAG: serine/threonine-protein kinase, partial [Caldimonas sp.]